MSCYKDSQSYSQPVFIPAHLCDCHLNFSCWVFWHVPLFPPFPSASNPCEENDGRGPCSHLCLINYNRTASCTCPHLMKLSPNKQSCFGEWQCLPRFSCFLLMLLWNNRMLCKQQDRCLALHISLCTFDWHQCLNQAVIGCCRDDVFL